MKIAIVRAENALGHGLDIISGYRTTSYQAYLCATQDGQGGRCAAAGTSYPPARAGDRRRPARRARRDRPKFGLCEPFPGPGDDNNHFSPLSGSECDGRAGGPAYGAGGVGAFASFDIHLVPYGS